MLKTICLPVTCLYCLYILLLVPSLKASSNTDSSPPEISSDENRVLKVSTGLPPYATFIKKIGGDKVFVITVLSNGSSPHSFSPSPKTIARVMRTDLYLSSGLPFEERIAGKLNTAQGKPEFINLSTNPADTCDEKSSSGNFGETSEHSEKAHRHSDISSRSGNNIDDRHCSHNHGDLHRWMNPIYVINICEKIRDILIRLAPKHHMLFETNFNSYKEKLVNTDKQLQTILQPYAGKAFYVYHPALGHFARRYKLTQHSLETSGGEPSGRKLTTIIRMARQEHAQVIFVQRDFPTRAAERLAQTIQGKVVIIDPLAPDYCNNLLVIGQLIAKYLKN